MPTGSITDQDVDFVETWENIASHQNVIVRLTSRGDERYEVITGRRTFMVTSQERLITEDKVLNDEDDPFRNGAFRPVVVPDSITIETNPNALSDKEITNVLKSSDLAWTEWMGTIDSVATLRRMLDLADESGDLTIKRYRQIEQRIVEVRGYERQRLVSKDPQLEGFLERQANKGPETSVNVAQSGKANPRRRGGRSADYR